MSHSRRHLAPKEHTDQFGRRRTKRKGPPNRLVNLSNVHHRMNLCIWRSGSSFIRLLPYRSSSTVLRTRPRPSCSRRRNVPGGMSRNRAAASDRSPQSRPARWLLESVPAVPEGLVAPRSLIRAGPASRPGVRFGRIDSQDRNQDPKRSGSRNESIPAKACSNASAAASSADANSLVMPKAAARAARQYRENSSPIAAVSPRWACCTSSRSGRSLISWSMCGHRCRLFAELSSKFDGEMLAAVPDARSMHLRSSACTSARHVVQLAPVRFNGLEPASRRRSEAPRRYLPTF